MHVDVIILERFVFLKTVTTERGLQNNFGRMVSVSDLRARLGLQPAHMEPSRPRAATILCQHNL
jgi:hypothetical protein